MSERTQHGSDHGNGSECRSCGARDVETTVVRRVYLTGPDGTVELDDPPEAWCGGCLGNYPHVVVDD